MTAALILLGIDAVLAAALWWMWRSGWMTDDTRIYRRK